MDAWYLEARRGLRSVERASLLERRQLARRAVVGVHGHAAHCRLGRSITPRPPRCARITPDGLGSGRLQLQLKSRGGRGIYTSGREPRAASTCRAFSHQPAPAARHASRRQSRERSSSMRQYCVANASTGAAKTMCRKADAPPRSLWPQRRHIHATNSA